MQGSLFFKGIIFLRTDDYTENQSRAVQLRIFQTLISIFVFYEERKIIKNIIDINSIKFK